MPCNYKEYHPKWSLIRRLILKRAKNKCEACGVAHHAVGYRDERGKFHGTCGNIYHDCSGVGLSYPSLKPLSFKEAKEMAEFFNDWPDGLGKYIVIVLTIAHLDHNKKNNRFANLKALCQRCHLLHDKSHHLENRKYGRKHREYQLKLFTH